MKDGRSAKAPLRSGRRSAQCGSSLRSGCEVGEEDCVKDKEEVHVLGVVKGAVYDMARGDVCVESVRDNVAVTTWTTVTTGWDKHADKMRMRKTCARQVILLHPPSTDASEYIAEGIERADKMTHWNPCFHTGKLPSRDCENVEASATQCRWRIALAQVSRR